MSKKGIVRSSRRKVKGRIKFRQSVGIVRKDSVQTGSLKKAPTEIPSNVATFKVKVKKK